MEEGKDEDLVIDIPVSGHRCPICGKEAVQRYKPFCSKRCADIDLNRWFTGVYHISSEESSEGGDQGEEGNQ